MFGKLGEWTGFGKSDDANATHPALANFDSGKERVKFIVKNTVKKAAKWALVGGLVLAGLALLPAAAVGGAGAVLSTLSFGLISTTGAGTAMLGAALGKGLLIGAIGGAISGALKGLVDSDEAVMEAEERRILNYDRASQRQRSEQAYAIQMQRQMSGGMMPSAGVAPGMTPMGQVMDGQGYGRSS